MLGLPGGAEAAREGRSRAKRSDRHRLPLRLVRGHRDGDHLFLTWKERRWRQARK